MSYRSPEDILTGCVWLPRFEIQVERWRQSKNLRVSVPLALFDSGRPPCITACSLEAEEEGLRPGMPVREAMATAPGALLLPADPPTYTEILSCLVEELESITPVLEPVPPGSVFLNLEGLVAADTPGGAGLYRTRSDLVRAIEKAIRFGAREGRGWNVRTGIGRGKFAAWAAARAGASGSPASSSPASGSSVSGLPVSAGAIVSRSGQTIWVRHDRIEEYLRPLPVGMLPVEAAMVRRLERFGIHTLGELARLPSSAVYSQFGKEGRRAWLLAHGKDEDPIRPRPPEVEIAETIRFEDPEATLTGLIAAAQQLLPRVLRRPERRGRSVRQIRLEARLESGRHWSETLTFKQPGTLAEPLFAPVRYRLETAHPAEAVETLTLSLVAFTLQGGWQGALFVEPAELRRIRLAGAVEHLRTQMGYVPVARVVEVEPWSRIPERQYQLLDCE